jgi:Kef-type K+ transport system membrane component KefB
LGAFAAGLILAETEKQILEQQIISIADFFVPRLCVCGGKN